MKVSALCFGTMTFGGDADEATSAALFGRCRDAGINFFDSADTYTHGRSEGHGYHPVSLAVAWVRAHPAVTAPLVGAHTVEQLDDSLRSTSIHLTPEQWSEIAALAPHPGVATDRTEDLAGFGYAPGAGDPGGPPAERSR